jgi:hypothetical protein
MEESSYKWRGTGELYYFTRSLSSQGEDGNSGGEGISIDEGVDLFEVRRRDGEVLVLHSLTKEMTSSRLHSQLRTILSLPKRFHFCICLNLLYFWLFSLFYGEEYVHFFFISSFLFIFYFNYFFILLFFLLIIATLLFFSPIHFTVVSSSKLLMHSSTLRQMTTPVYIVVNNKSSAS